MKINAFATTLIALIVVAHPALAQMNPAKAVQELGILADPGLQADLKLDAEQVAQANAVAVEARRSYQAMVAPLRALPSQEFMKQTDGMYRTLKDQGMAVLKASFKPEQIGRYEQILLQQAGPSAMLRDDINKVLELTDKQQAKIQAIVQDTMARGGQITREYILKADLPREEYPVRMNVLYKDTFEKADAVLTPEQKARWNALIGPPFRLILPPLPRPAAAAPAPSRPQ